MKLNIRTPTLSFPLSAIPGRQMYFLCFKANSVRYSGYRIRCLSTIPVPPIITAGELGPASFPRIRSWLVEFRKVKLERSDAELSFSRSSGPGGQVSKLFVWAICSRSCILNFGLLLLQNVNKLNTKASARCSLHSTWIPEWARPGLKSSVSGS